jgi:hypothetical protein
MRSARRLAIIFTRPRAKQARVNLAKYARGNKRLARIAAIPLRDSRRENAREFSLSFPPPTPLLIRARDIFVPPRPRSSKEPTTARRPSNFQVADKENTSSLPSSSERTLRADSFYFAKLVVVGEQRARCSCTRHVRIMLSLINK